MADEIYKPRCYDPDVPCFKVSVIYRPAIFDSSEASLAIVHLPKAITPWSAYLKLIDGEDDIIELPETIGIHPEGFDLVSLFLEPRVGNPENADIMDASTMEQGVVSVHKVDSEFVSFLTNRQIFQFGIACDFLGIDVGLALFAKYVGSTVDKTKAKDLDRVFAIK